MSDDRKKILAMLAAGKLSVDEAEELLGALAMNQESKDSLHVAPPPSDSSSESPAASPLPRYLRIQVTPRNSEGGDRVNIRVPLQILRSGVQLASFLPEGAKTSMQDALQKKGIDLNIDKINAKNMDELIRQISDFSVDVDSPTEEVRIFCE